MGIEDVYRREREMSHRAMRVPDGDPATAKMRATILNGTTVVIGYFFTVFFRRRILAPLLRPGDRAILRELALDRTMVVAVRFAPPGVDRVDGDLRGLNRPIQRPPIV